MRILIAPDSFKDCMTAKAVGMSIKKGLQKVSAEYEAKVIPVADGGEGTVESLVDATQGAFVQTEVYDALRRKRIASYGILGDNKTAVIEMAQASGIEHLAPEDRNPWITTTFGTGQMISDALGKGCKRIIIGIGGSATNDGGVGMAQALGVEFLDAHGALVGDGGGALGTISSINISGIDERIKDCEIIVACDVNNPLTGTNGASAVYGPQKGASPEMVKQLDNNLEHFSDKIKESLNKDVKTIPGAGAAGGLGAGLLAFCNGELQPGFEIVAHETSLAEHCAWADLVITGEGKIDFQTKFGKTPQGVANYAKRYKKTVIAIAGTLGENYTALYDTGFDAIFSILDRPMELKQALTEAPDLIENFGHTLGMFLKAKNSGK